MIIHDDVITSEFAKIGKKALKTKMDISNLVALHSIMVESDVRLLKNPLKKTRKIEFDKSVGLKQSKKIAKLKHLPYRDFMAEKLTGSRTYIFTDGISL